MRHLKPLVILAAMSLVWTWPLALHFHDHLPGLPGDNYSFVWNIWWMRKALSAPELDFFRSNYLLNPFGFDLVNHPHTALYGFISATVLAWVPVIEAQNLLIVGSTFLNGACAYLLAYDIVRERRVAVLAGFVFGGSPYIAAHLFGRFDLVAAWVIPLFALFLRRALQSGRIMPAVGCGMSLAMAAYTAYDYVVYLGVFALVYTIAASAWRPSADESWRAVQVLMITTAVFIVLCLPLVVQAFRVAAGGRYVSQVDFWRSAPRGVDALAPFLGNPFHPLYGDTVSRWYQNLGLDHIDAVGWIGVVPVILLFISRGNRVHSEARRWKIVMIVFAIWALGPSLTIAGFNTGLPLPQAVTWFLPLIELAPMPGRAMVCVYLALGMLIALRSAGQRFSPAVVWGCIGLIGIDYLYAPLPLTALDRPAVYEHLASIDDNGAVIELPFGIGDRQRLYYATIHGHPVVGGDVGPMPPGVAQAYATMPIVGNLLRLSNGGERIEERASPAVPFRYLVLDTMKASPELVEYVQSTLDLDLIASGDGKQLFAVQGARPGDLRAEIR